LAAGPPTVGIFGGSGFYSFLEADFEDVEVETPFGTPSAPVRIGEIGGARVAFMPRHGRHHEYPAHRVPYRANVWAMREAGVRRILAPCACGSLRPDLEPGSMVVLDQYFDRTSGREHSFYDDAPATHVSAAEPYCDDLRRILVACGRELGVEMVDGGTVVVVQGPRFSTRAESRWFMAQGFDVVNMTNYPECHLARELELCYASVALVTDYDSGVAADHGISVPTAEEIVAVFKANIDTLRRLLTRAVPEIGPQPTDVCATALQGARFE
jgi:5'-methylthioadenosine phosphorylase